MSNTPNYVTVSSIPGGKQPWLQTLFRDISLIMEMADSYAMKVCPSGIDRCECMNAPGTFSKGPFNPNGNILILPFSVLAHLVCNPSHCYCKDNPKKELDIRPQFFSSFIDLCPKNELDRCLCDDDKTKMRAPFNIISASLCRPKKCTCKRSDKG